MAGGGEFGNHGGADPTRRAGNENTHEQPPVWVDRPRSDDARAVETALTSVTVMSTIAA